MIELKGNPNYGAIVVNDKTPHEFIDMPGFDKVRSLKICGLNIITRKDLDLSAGAIVFPTESKLSEKYLKENNLYKNKLLNKDNSIQGYFDASGRVKAIKFGKGMWDSNGLIMPISSLEYIPKFDSKELTPNTVFDTVNGVTICQKYVIVNSNPNSNSSISKIQGKLKSKIPLPQHVDTKHWGRVSVSPESFCTVTQKLHGTSARYGYLEVERKLNFIEKILLRLGVKIQKTEYKKAYGSRRIVKSLAKNKSGYYANDVWSSFYEQISNKLEKGQVVYGEIIGYDGEKPIQNGYTYGLLVNEKEFYVYRITTVNDGVERDWSPEQIKHWCNKNNIKTVPTLAVLKANEVESWLDSHKNCNFSALKDNITIDKPVTLRADIPDEGVVLRFDDGVHPIFLKSKWPAFLIKESAQLDLGKSDYESEN